MGITSKDCKELFDMTIEDAPVGLKKLLATYREPYISHVHRLGLQDSIVCKCESLRKDSYDCKTYYEFIDLLDSVIFTLNRRIERIKERIEDEKESD